MDWYPYRVCAATYMLRLLFDCYRMNDDGVVFHDGNQQTDDFFAAVTCGAIREATSKQAVLPDTL